MKIGFIIFYALLAMLMIWMANYTGEPALVVCAILFIAGSIVARLADKL